MSDKPVTVPDIIAAKGNRKLAMLTAYDYAVAALLDKAGLDMILVGDSLAMVGLGMRDTLAVGMEAMLHHTRAVSRGVSRALVVGDMPFGSYQPSVELAVTNAIRFMSEGRASAVKVEGGARMLPQVEAMVRADIPVMGHVGLTPQSVAKMGGFKVQGKSAEAARVLMDDAMAMAEAGCFAIVLEAMPAPVAERITEALPIPTISIGAGPGCDGQVLVTNDVLGLFDRFTPRFVKRFGEVGQAVLEAAQAYVAEVRQGTFPGPEHCFTMSDEEKQRLEDM